MLASGRETVKLHVHSELAGTHERPFRETPCARRQLVALPVTKAWSRSCSFTEGSVQRSRELRTVCHKIDSVAETGPDESFFDGFDCWNRVAAAEWTAECGMLASATLRMDLAFKCKEAFSLSLTSAIHHVRRRNHVSSGLVQIRSPLSISKFPSCTAGYDHKEEVTHTFA